MTVSSIDRYLLILLLFAFGLCQAQEAIDENLKKELDGVLKSDQILREYIDSQTSESRKLQILNETGYSRAILKMARYIK